MFMFLYVAEEDPKGRNVRQNKEQITASLDTHNYQKMNHPKDKFDAVRRNPYSIKMFIV